MKRLAFFLDGTWNTHHNNTNVWRLGAMADPNVHDQLVYYGQGVGTRFGEKYRGGAAGHGIDDEIIDAYSWLVRHFESGDEIYIFGFSRGAYAARSFSGLIAKCGVLRPGAPLSIEQLYKRYRRRTDKTINQLLADPQAASSIEERWVMQYCISINIKFVGIWDTVGSLGAPWLNSQDRIERFRFLDTHLRMKNEYAFHALALDEHRRKFEPTFWTRTVDNQSGEDVAAGRSLNHVEQRWFPGAHANVGGGYPSDVLAQRPLHWIMEKAAKLGLRFRSGFTPDEQSHDAPIADSYADFVPYALRMISRRFHRVVGLDPERGTVRTTGRINETIDASVFDRWRVDSAYRPPSIQEWAIRRGVDPATLTGSRLAIDPAVQVPDV